MTFAALMARHPWRPIRGCPGRFVCADPALGSRPVDLAFGVAEARAFVVDGARDRVVVARLDGGGLISYARADGTHCHTLADAAGFARKLAALGIALDAA